MILITMIKIMLKIKITQKKIRKEFMRMTILSNSYHDNNKYNTYYKQNTYQGKKHLLYPNNKENVLSNIQCKHHVHLGQKGL